MKVYLGKQEGYGGKTISEDDLAKEIHYFQKTHEERFGYFCALRKTSTSFQAKDYEEAGWELAAIQYPRFEKTEEQIVKFMQRLTRHLLKTLKQNRMSLIAILKDDSFVELFGEQ